MASYQFSNNATTTLAAAATAGTTSLSVASATGFPTSGDFAIIIDGEIMLVTGVVGTTFTVARAQEGTSAAAHSLGATVTHVVTARPLQGLMGGTAFPASPRSGERFFRTDRGVDYYYDGTRWLSVHVETSHIQAISGATAAITGYGPKIAESIYVVDLVLSTFVSTTNDAVNYWGVAFQYFDGSAATTPVGTAQSTIADTAGVWTAHTQSGVNLVIPSSAEGFQLVAVLNAGTPGALYATPMIRYRLIG